MSKSVNAEVKPRKNEPIEKQLADLEAK